jgi:preprotein translocase subunit SecE
MALLGGDFGRTLASATPYKPGQGNWARLGTFALLVLAVVAAGYSWSRTMAGSSTAVKYGVPAVAGALFIWAAYRLIHWPRYADFLITTESEMNKVSWPSRQEVKTSTIVVLILSGFLAIFLSSVDWIWQWILYHINILEFRSSVLGDSG